MVLRTLFSTITILRFAINREKIVSALRRNKIKIVVSTIPAREKLKTFGECFVGTSIITICEESVQDAVGLKLNVFRYCFI